MRVSAKIVITLLSNFQTNLFYFTAFGYFAHQQIWCQDTVMQFRLQISELTTVMLVVANALLFSTLNLIVDPLTFLANQSIKT